MIAFAHLTFVLYVIAHFISKNRLVHEIANSPSF